MFPVDQKSGRRSSGVNSQVNRKTAVHSAVAGIPAFALVVRRRPRPVPDARARTALVVLEKRRENSEVTRKRHDSQQPDGHLAGELIRKTVRDQIRGHQPPETEQAYRRLRTQGYSDGDAVELIAAVLAAEMFYILTQQREHDPIRYATMLKRLPELPSEDDA